MFISLYPYGYLPKIAFLCSATQYTSIRVNTRQRQDKNRNSKTHSHFSDILPLQCSLKVNIANFGIRVSVFSNLREVIKFERKTAVPLRRIAPKAKFGMTILYCSYNNISLCKIILNALKPHWKLDSST